jgi:hypothetical protein
MLISSRAVLSGDRFHYFLSATDTESLIAQRWKFGQKAAP